MDELKKMGRSELVEIIYQLRRALDEKDNELADCRQKLAEKRTNDAQSALTEAMKAELHAAVAELRADVTAPMQAQIDALSRERDALRQELAAQKAAWTNAGSLAEAVVSVNGLMEDAQRAADQYLAGVKDSERAAESILENARQEATRITQQAEKEAEERMAAFRAACQTLIEQQQALRGLLGEENA